MSTAPVAPIQVERVTKVYDRKVRALSEVSFALQPGDRTCLLGPNGAGKTTLIRLLAGALGPTEGVVRLFGEDVSGPRFLDAKRRVGIVPQGPGMYRELTAGEYLDWVRRIYRRGEVARVVEAFGLGEFLHRRMAQLSGGTQRRLSLAAALLSDPELLLLDEPTAGMDPLVTREVHGYLREAMRNRTVLLCTHNLEEAEALGESVIILRSGRMLVHERIEVLRNQSRPAVLLRALSVDPLLAALQTAGIAFTRAGDQARIPVDAPEQEVPPLLRRLLGAGVEVIECRIVRPTLEELFVDAVVGNNHGP